MTQPNKEELVEVPKEQIDLLLIRSNMELIQKVDRLLDLIETEIAKAKGQ